MSKGYVQVYTGAGKGKTTAAIGLAIRALGAGKKVLMIQFMKSPSYSEHRILSGISPNFRIEAIGKPFFIADESSIPAEDLAKLKDQVVIFPPGNPPAEYVELAQSGIGMAKEALSGGDYDLVILDELNVAMHFGLVAWTDVEAIIDEKAEKTEVVITGRNAPAELMERADLVTEMREIKHYYSQGVMARKGIEN
ncbi:MAG: cob(I)yrinic acid a,c-diamide adenosyltransferase [Eubacteriales bacterium]|jgi:cob(I)alamin adenosyltransferase|nr:cob(I)yrinic acid a,c-diamide adenosyltransferase [Eubacteriales bacterium]NLV70817.1 cob(I)yrinic acid a,c-diamide adenosyltransferase [Clostridiales bacterium]HPF18692.1 cob(I)yrinic acid a,c-diamide adenosyltransferase [Bacillota bacterium]HRV33222.1 cob(I)yrinic acid a,c-diamide adenosyltransferase [Anaerovoracaceae bacterium]MDD3537446.1 cob(I)yrinic acid a,c-diamide adenosyltransferase [Eubacteriales bacterium]